MMKKRLNKILDIGGQNHIKKRKKYTKHKKYEDSRKIINILVKEIRIEKIKVKKLPNEITAQIIQYCSIQDFVNISKINKYFNLLGENDYIWKMLLNRDYKMGYDYSNEMLYNYITHKKLYINISNIYNKTDIVFFSILEKSQGNQVRLRKLLEIYLLEHEKYKIIKLFNIVYNKYLFKIYSSMQCICNNFLDNKIHTGKYLDNYQKLIMMGKHNIDTLIKNPINFYYHDPNFYIKFSTIDNFVNKTFWSFF